MSFELPEHIKRRMQPHRGRQSPPVQRYVCTGCAYDKPTIRDGEHVRCAKCGAAPNPQLALLWNLPDWPRITTTPEAA
jgi:hypothetical protein